MPKIAHFADTHIKLGPKFADTMRCLEFAVDDAIERNVHVFVHAGDVFDTGSVPDERNAVAGLTRRMTDHAPVIYVRGNHDKRGDLAIFAELRGKHPVHVFERMGHVDIAGIRFLCLPYFDKGNLAAILPPDASVVEENAIAADEMKIAMRYLAMLAAAWSGPVVLVSHLTVTGSMLGKGQPLVGHWGIELSVGDIMAVGATYTALGHIHLAQEFAEGRIRFPGSTNRFTFGESEAKGYNVVTMLNKDDMPDVTWVELPTRPMYLMDGDWTGEGFTWVDRVEPDQAVGADVRIRLRYSEDQQVFAAAAIPGIEAEYAGANTLKIEPVMLATQRVRSVAVSEAMTVADKLDAFWAAGVRPDEVTAARLLKKLADMIESEAAQCA